MQKFRVVKINNSKGFTLVELLVVIGIIALLASFLIVNLSRAREKARIVRVQADLVQIRKGIELLVQDTGKWPNGCNPDIADSPETFLDMPLAGLLSVPDLAWAGAATNNNGGKFDPTWSPNPATVCGWTAQDVANWKGPYSDHVKDPWLHAYFFDPDYAYNGGTVGAAILSRGVSGGSYYPYSGGPPTGQASNGLTDIYLIIGK